MRTLVEQAEAVRRRQVSPVELVEAALAAIERTQPALNAFTHVLADDALRRARQLERAEPSGPLHGVPVAVKELYDVAGVPTTGCCAAYADRIAPADSAVVERLRAAGAIVVAKTNQHELATGATNRISSHGPCFNPHGQGRSPGGSSGGSAAAVAAGVVAMAMGSDTGGSIRIPASFCGITGLKPTFGAVSLRGAMPLAPSLDTAGPLAPAAADCSLAFSVLAGFDPDDPWSAEGRQAPPRELRGLRIALPRPFYRLLHPETRSAVERAATDLEELGAVVDWIPGPDPDDAWACGPPILLTEFAHHYRDLWDDPRPHPETRALLGFGRSHAGPDLVGHYEAARRLRRDFERALASADALLAPATPYPAPPMDAGEVEVEGGRRDVHAGGPARLTLPVNLAGLPAVAFCVGTSSEGLPLGAQLIGQPWSEQLLLGVVAAYHEATAR